MSKAKKGYYTRLVTDLLSKEEDFPHFASQSLGLSRSRCVKVRGKDTIDVGTGLSDFIKEILKSLLRQGVKVLSPEVEERSKSICSAKGASPDVDARNTPSKRLKKSFRRSLQPAFLHFLLLPIPSLAERLSLLSNYRFSVLNGAEGHSTETARFVVGAEEPKHRGQVEETLQLEKLLDTVMSSCRSYPRNIFDHVVEMILHRNAAYTSSDENRVDLERQCYYVEAVEKARKLAKNESSGRSSPYQG
ncbi:unnamed protein product [Malus baccata var. baccata]